MAGSYVISLRLSSYAYCAFFKLSKVALMWARIF